MVVTESGMLTVVRDPHFSNALFPMAVTESGMLTVIRESQE